MTRPRFRCGCVNVAVGSYGNQVTLDVPPTVDVRFNAPGRAPKARVSVDACLAGEIRHLWSLGIVTTGCCCGHNRAGGFPYIGVGEAWIPAMKALGYEVAPNPARPGDEDSFYPRSLARYTLQAPEALEDGPMNRRAIDVATSAIEDLTADGPDRDHFRLRLRNPVQGVDVGRTVRLAYPRYGLDQGRDMMVVAMHEADDSDEVVVELLG